MFDLPGSVSPSSADHMDLGYAVKRITFFDQVDVPVVCQNSNGPCPLLAIANALFLLRRLDLPDVDFVSSEELLGLIGGYVAERAASIYDPARAGDQCEQLNDVVGLLPRLTEGLDVNVRFADVECFEASPSMSVFDLAGLRLVHGWTVCAATEPEAAAAMAGLSFNVAQNLLARAQSPAHADATGGGGGTAAGVPADLHGGDPPLLGAGEVATGDPAAAAVHPAPAPASLHVVRAWLDETRSQLTAAGLRRIAAVLVPLEVAVLFRNDHFSTVLRLDPRLAAAAGAPLVALVTDLGYADVGEVVWEALGEGSVRGDTRFLGRSFMPVAPLAPAHVQPPQPLPQPQPRRSVAAAAAATVRDPAAIAAAAAALSAFVPPQPPHPPPLEPHSLSDYEVAVQMQREEEAAAAAEAGSAGGGGSGGAGPRPQTHAAGGGGGGGSRSRVERPPDFDGLSPEEQAELDAALRLSTGGGGGGGAGGRTRQPAPTGRPTTGTARAAAAHTTGTSASPPRHAAAAARGGSGRNDRYAQAASVLRDAAEARQQRQAPHGGPPRAVAAASVAGGRPPGGRRPPPPVSPMEGDRAGKAGGGCAVM